MEFILKESYKTHKNTATNSVSITQKEKKEEKTRNNVLIHQETQKLQTEIYSRN